MLLGNLYSLLASYVVPTQKTINSQTLQPAYQFSHDWKVLGPFQIGTREAVWGADPLEHHGGFHSLPYQGNATFRSSLAVNGTISWSTVTANLTDRSRIVGAELLVDFPEVEWESLRNVYGWSAYQWQAWLRGEIIVQDGLLRPLTLRNPQILEFWIDHVHYFGGDFYSYENAHTVLRLAPGRHQIDIRLVRDVRAMGGVEKPQMLVNLALVSSWPGLLPVLQPRTGILISDLIGSPTGQNLASPWASVVLRNDDLEDLYIYAVEATHNACLAELASDNEIRLVPGQSRPVAFRISCVRSDWRVRIDFKYRRGGLYGLSLTVLADLVHRIAGEPHKVTFLHPSGTVSYAILRAPSRKAIDAAGNATPLPVLLGLHGAGVEVERDDMRLALEPLPDLPAWVLFPTGGTPWSGDDWHAFGFTDVEAAIDMIDDWIEHNGWRGPGINTKKWLVAGHSNGGQGTWYTLLHRPDNVIAAAPLSGYSSIQNYVPHTFWQAADPGRTVVVQAALGSYRHELLLSNSKGIPVLQQHGGKDDNVPPYHSRLQSQLIGEAGANSTYLELAGQPHFWDGVFTTDPLKAFYKQQIERSNAMISGFELQDFTMTVANPADTGPKHGVHVLQLHTPGQLGRIDVLFDALTSGCVVRTTNIRMFQLPTYFSECSVFTLDKRNVSLSQLASDHDCILSRRNGTWHVVDDRTDTLPQFPPRLGRQLGQMDSVLRTHGAFQIVEHSNDNTTRHIALQISRNLCQYFSADAALTSDYQSALEAPGNIISVAIGPDLPVGYHKDFAVKVENGQIRVRNSFGVHEDYVAIAGLGLAAIFLRPLPLGRLELVVWGVDEASLAIAARPVPIMPGSGQPDFVIADRTMLAKGLEGVLAMGFFDGDWEVSRNSFLS
ncbi:Putative alpha/Beta hydrolase [Septoria linicola]|uniref:Alpha/Beta hydrolase n=1 Tax=Septoria linicola TaxID=215465 RepID=A0A9Q9AJ71_9PEZI|nr:Putative alpha/Beta hydrolase [Septoria linicola]